ncbi:MAG: DUF4965 domain-containing protein [Cytophagales bacterium]|nr:DUF4965 domain-containing protein [Armatimonadota bacterium]
MLVLTVTGAVALPTAAQELSRPPSVPLVTHDPYFSVWSAADTLSGDDTRHWTGTTQSLNSLVRIDGKTYRLMGKDPSTAPALKQTRLEVLPTRTIYTFEGAGAQVVLTFTSPMLPDDLDLLSRPVTYLTWEVRATDGKSHAASLYFDASAQLVVNQPDQKVMWRREKIGNLTALRMGTEAQPVLQKRGDDLRIDWGNLYVATSQPGAKGVIASRFVATESFAKNGQIPSLDDSRMPRPAGEENPVSAFVLDLGSVSAKPVSRRLLLAYDDEYSITYFRRNLRPYWRRNGMTANQLLQTADRDYAKLQARCLRFDNELMADLTRVGGKQYAWIAALAYRQALAAQKLVADANGQPLSFSKENFSNGCIATVDVIYPASPQLLLFSPTLVKASLVPLLSYSASPRWKWPFAPHDLGTYPIANGQVYGGGERTEENQMPVEESGNMLLMLAALAKSEGNADFVAPYWPTITQWADYLTDKGFDPESQLSTDDFAGHLAHNVNLSAKAIEAIGAYAYLCELRGDKLNAAKYRKTAESFAARWVKEGDNGDYTRLAFDKPDTWSQKYNLAWDRILGLNLFPQSMIRKEMAFYRTKLNRYGLPLDSRENYTKLDWTIWTATLSGDRSDFISLVTPVYDFLNVTPDRVPMTDWYRTIQPQKAGFQARSTVGGVFIKMMDDPATWRKWVSRDKNTARGWAALPLPPKITTVVPTSQQTGLTWRYTTQTPSSAAWFQPSFDDSAWQTGQAGFGTRDTPGAVVRTEWNTSDIWIRREFTMPAGSFENLQLLMHHDEEADIYINGTLAARAGGFTGQYDLTPLTAEGRAALKPGKNTIAIHCHQTGGGQYIDAGFSTLVESN